MNLISQNITFCSEMENWNSSIIQKKGVICGDIENFIPFKCFMNQDFNEINKHTCKLCGNNFFQLYNNEDNKNINCYESLMGYYLDKNDLLFKRCYDSCKTCEITGTVIEHNCIECNDNYTYEFNLSKYKNCFTNNPYDITTDIISNAYTNYLPVLTSDITNEEITQKENQNEYIQNIINNLFKELNLTDIDNAKDKTISKNNLDFIFTSTENQKINEDEKRISMDFTKCEKILKNEYNISINDSLYIFQIIYEEEGMKIPKLEYEVYYPIYNSNNLTKLNLTSCQDIKIDISIIVEINDTLDKYNPKSDYYNNICTKATSESNTDIILKDRQNEFVENNMPLCEENCDLINYKYTSKKVLCSCDVKLEMPEIQDIKFNKEEFFKSFTDIKNIININVMKCYRTVFKIKDLMKNYGFYIISFIISLYFIQLIVFCSFSFYKLKINISKILFALKKTKASQANINHNNDNMIVKTQSNKKRKKRKKKKFGKINQQNNLKKENETKEPISNLQYNKECFEQKMGNNSLELIVDNKILNENVLELKDFEINSLDYEEALIIDKRNYFQYYISLLKYNHPLTFSFAPFDDYNSRIIKIFLFFFSLSLDFTINTLFFNDDNMHKIYIDRKI